MERVLGGGHWFLLAGLWTMPPVLSTPSVLRETLPLLRRLPGENLQ